MRMIKKIKNRLEFFLLNIGYEIARRMVGAIISVEKKYNKRILSNAQIIKGAAIVGALYLKKELAKKK